MALLGLAQGALLGPRPVPVAGRAVAGRAASPAISMQQQTSSPKGVVVTGGAGGVGYAYADEFLARGHWVVICDVKDPEPAVQSLRQKHAGGLGRVYGTTTDVRSRSPAAAPAGAAGRSGTPRRFRRRYWFCPYPTTWLTRSPLAASVPRACMAPCISVQ
jgi:chlorophyll(ide) b reductase